VCRAVSAGLAGTVSSSQTDRPLFVRNTTLEVTKFDLTLYTVTINGTVCTYMSDASATKTEIIDGLVTDINSKISGSVGYALNFQGELTFIPVQGGLPTITAGANIVKTDLSPSFSQVSTIWQGNKNQVNSVEVYPWAYIAYGDACGNYVALGNSGTFASVTDWKLVKHTAWSSSDSQHNPTPEQLAGKTHWYRFVDTVVVSSGAL
jgi:hypothetical protein